MKFRRRKKHDDEMTINAGPVKVRADWKQIAVIIALIGLITYVILVYTPIMNLLMALAK